MVRGTRVWDVSDVSPRWLDHLLIMLQMFTYSVSYCVQKKSTYLADRQVEHRKGLCRAGRSPCYL